MIVTYVMNLNLMMRVCCLIRKIKVIVLDDWKVRVDYVHHLCSLFSNLSLFSVSYQSVKVCGFYNEGSETSRLT